MRMTRQTMKSKLILFFSILVLTGCDIAENRPDCSAVSCEFISIPVKIRYVDKATNKPLFSPGSSYTLTDLKITGQANSNYKPEAKIDPNDPSVIIIKPVFGGEVLTLGNLNPDLIGMKRKNRNNECCSLVDVVSLIINGEVICTPCTDLNATVAVLKK